MLAWRVHRTAIWSWTVAVVVLGALMGAIAPSVGDLLDTEAGRAMIESLGGVGALQDALLAAVLSITAVLVTCFALTVIGHGATDEHDGRTEQVLATATSRSRAFLATGTIALVGAAWLLAVTGVATALGLGAAGRRHAASAWPRWSARRSTRSPAVWVVVALALLLYAVASRWSVLGWGVLTAFFVVGQLGELLKLPDAVIGLSPFTHVPAMPVEPFTAGPALTLTALAAALTVARVVALPGARHRLACQACGSRSRAGSRCPEARAPPPSGSGAPSRAAARWPSSGWPVRARTTPPRSATRGTSPTGAARPTWSSRG